MAPSPPLTDVEIRRWTHVGVLSALALLLGYVETFVPIPLPGVKLGLANIAVLAALATGDVAGAASISAIKVLASGLLFGSPLTMAYSAAGTLLAFAGMAPLSRLRTMRLAMVSVVGALLHELGQLAIAALLLDTTAVWYTAPVLLLAGCVTGFVCGTLATGLATSLTLEYKDLDADGYTRIRRRFSVSTAPAAATGWLALALLVAIVVLFHLQGVPALVGFFGTSAALALVCGVGPHDLLASMRPLAPLVALTLVIQLFVSPQSAVVEAGRALLRLASIAALCSAFMRRVPTHDLTALVARMLRPLSRAGVRTEGFLLAFDVAVRLVPTMGSLVQPGTFALRDLGQLVPHIYTQLLTEALTGRG